MPDPEKEQASPVGAYACLADGVEESRVAALAEAGCWLRDSMHRVDDPRVGVSHLTVASIREGCWWPAIVYGQSTPEIRERLGRDFGIQAR